MKNVLPCIVALDNMPDTHNSTFSYSRRLAALEEKEKHTKDSHSKKTSGAHKGASKHSSHSRPEQEIEERLHKLREKPPEQGTHNKQNCHGSASSHSYTFHVPVFIHILWRNLHLLYVSTTTYAYFWQPMFTHHACCQPALLNIRYFLLIIDSCERTRLRERNQRKIS